MTELCGIIGGQMTEFITRNHGNSCFEIIIKTTNPEHYKATQDFARRLIDHAKPMSNADRIRAMNDRELAEFLADHDIKQSCMRLYEKGVTPTATQLAEITTTLVRAYSGWLQMPTGDE
jgi:hypothetical protein